MSVSENNIVCQLWSVQKPQTHIWPTLGSELNYCRNPNPLSDDERPWCYQSEGYRFSECDVPRCGKYHPYMYRYLNVQGYFNLHTE